MGTRHFTKGIAILRLIIFFTVFTSCRKEADKPFVTPVVQELEVRFATNGVPVTEVDLIVVVVRNENHEVKKWETLQQATSSFKLKLEGLAAGKYNAEILVHSKKRTDLTARQYALSTNIELPLQQSLVINGPAGSFSDQWLQRAVFLKVNSRQ